jgi:hypothetical protein
LGNDIEIGAANEQSEIIQAMLMDKFANLDTYWECFDPYEVAAPVMYTISDCLADIYGDIKAGLLKYDCGASNSIELAIDQWWGNHFHWGLHLVNALKVLHCTLQTLSDAEETTTLSACDN